MSNIYTGNIFLSTSREALDKVFFSKNKISSIKDGILSLTEKEIKQTFLSSPFKNTNLIEFEYSLGKDTASKYQLRLKFLETDSLFELFFIGKSVESIMLKKLYDALYGEQDPKISNKKKENIEKIIFNRENSDVILDPIKLFFSFGVGDDLSDWAGPFVANLQKSYLITNSEGLKEIEMLFTPTDDFFQSNEIEENVRYGLDAAINKYNRIISNSANIVNSVSTEIKFSELVGNEHKTISELIKKYIINTSQNSNAIVLLPDIQPGLKESIESAKKKRQNMVNGEKVLNAFNPEVFPDIKLLYKKFFNELNIDFETKVKDYNIPLTLEAIQEDSKRVDDTVILTFKTDGFDQEELASVIPDFFFPLKRFLDGVKILYQKQNLSTDIVFAEENDLRVLSLWKKYGFIKDRYKPCNLFISKKYKDEMFYLSNIKSKNDITKGIITVGIALNDIGYGNTAYKLEFYEAFLKVPIESSFKENVLLQDELSIDKTINSAKLLASVNNTPIFKYNTRNSNVLGLSILQNFNYTNAFNFGLKKKIYAPFVNIGVKQLEEEIRSLVPQDLVELVKKSLNDVDFSNLPGLIKEISKLYLSESIVKNPDLLLKLNTNKISESLTKDQLITYIAILINLNSLSLKPSVTLTKSQNEAIVQREILTALQNISIVVKIKTLPFFRLSGAKITGTTCLLLSLQNSIVGGESNKVISYYTGLYSIVAFNHVINNGEMYSEFTLQRNIADSQTTESITSSDKNLPVKDLLKAAEESRDKQYLDILKKNGIPINPRLKGI